MAVGWSRDGAVQDQIDADVKGAVNFALPETLLLGIAVAHRVSHGRAQAAEGSASPAGCRP